MGCNLEIPVKDGGIQKLDRVHGHHDGVTRVHLSLNMNVGKMNYCLGNLDLSWAIFSKWGQNFSREGKQNLFVAVWNSLLVNVWTNLCSFLCWQKFEGKLKPQNSLCSANMHNFSRALPWNYAS